MFPYKDDNPTLSTPVVTYALIGVNVLVWLVIQGMGQSPGLEASVCQYGSIPGRLFGYISPGTVVRLGPDVSCQVGSFPAWTTVLSSMFMHGGWIHLIGNMWFLWIFGNNVEDSTGRFRFCCSISSAEPLPCWPRASPRRTARSRWSAHRVRSAG